MNNMLNSQGEIINCTSSEHIAEPFLPLLHAVSALLQQTLGEHLHSVYVYGSIPEGRAVVGTSDGDFLIILRDPIQDVEELMHHISEQVMEQFSDLVIKVDVPTVTIQEVLLEQNLYSWGAYLKILCMPIAGEDVRDQFPMFVPSVEIARGFNGDLATYIEETLQILKSSVSEAEKQKRIRATAGKIIRSFFMLIAPKIHFWTTILNEQTQKVIDYFPEYETLFSYFIESRQGKKDIGEFVQQLEVFHKKLLPIFDGKIQQKYSPGL